MKIGMREHSLFTMQESFDGFCGIVANAEPELWKSRISECVAIIGNSQGLSRRAWESKMEEAWGSEDFPLIMGDVIDRDIQARYNVLGDGLRVVFGKRLVRSIGTVTSKSNYLTGLRGRHYKASKGGEYTQAEMGEGEYEYSVDKYGIAFSIFWEDLINDTRNIFATVPSNLAQGARYTEDWFITNMLFDENGPRDVYFTGTGGQTSVSNLPLTVGNLKIAYHEFITRTGRDTGELIQIAPAYLWHSKHLTLDVQQILGAALMITGENGTVPNTNPVSNLGLQPLPLNWLNLVVTTANPDGMWGLFASDTTIPVGEFAGLSGHEGPQVFVEESNARRVSGSGSVGVPEGSFSNERYNYKCRSVFGGTLNDPRAGWASDGY